MVNIKNKIIIVTGGASGIGYQYVEMLLCNGAKNVAMIDLPISNGPNAMITLEKEFGKDRIIFFACDVTKTEDLKNTFQKVFDTFNGLDIVINNAGMLNDNCIDKTIDLNIRALIHSSLLAIDYMGKHKGGKGGLIVNISSIIGLKHSFSFPIYTASKFAVIGFSQSLADSYQETGVRVLIMCPGVTMTKLVTNIPGKIFDFINPESMETEVKEYPTQSIEHVALAMLDLIQKGKNGATWVSEGGQQPYAVDFPHYSKRSLPV